MLREQSHTSEAHFNWHTFFDQRRVLPLMLLLFCTINISIQGQTTRWLFSPDIQITMDEKGVWEVEKESHSVRPLTESYTLFAKEDGNLVFYTNGDRIYDTDNNLIWESPLLPLIDESIKNSSRQGVLIVKSSLMDPVFYLYRIEQLESFQSGDELSQGRLSVTKISVDETRNKVVVGETTVLDSNIAEMMAVVQNPCGGLWFVVHERFSDQFLIYHIVEGQIIQRKAQNLGKELNKKIHMRAEYIISNTNEVFIYESSALSAYFRVDPYSGDIKNYKLISDGDLYLNGSFSPSGRYFYGWRKERRHHQIARLDMENGMEEAIVAEFELSEFESFGFDFILGPDSDIYISSDRGSLSAIRNADGDIEDVIFELEAVDFDANSNSYVFPKLVVHPHVPERQINDLTICIDTLLILDNMYENVEWSTGERDYSEIIDSSGKYWVQYEGNGCTYRDTFEVMREEIVLTFEPMVEICDSGSAVLSVESADPTLRYLWSTGETKSSIKVDQAGMYSLETSNDNGCMRMDVIEVVENEKRSVVIQDTTICDGQSVRISVDSSAYSSIRWNDGLSTFTRQISEGGVYSAEMTPCAEVVSFRVSVDDCSVEPQDCEIHLPNALQIGRGDIDGEYPIFSTCKDVQYQVKIYDRWGNLVAQSANNPSVLPHTIQQGVYNTKVRYHFGDGQWQEMLGTLTVFE